MKSGALHFQSTTDVFESAFVSVVMMCKMIWVELNWDNILFKGQRLVFSEMTKMILESWCHMTFSCSMLCYEHRQKRRYAFNWEVVFWISCSTVGPNGYTFKLKAKPLLDLFSPLHFHDWTCYLNWFWWQILWRLQDQRHAFLFIVKAL